MVFGVVSEVSELGFMTPVDTRSSQPLRQAGNVNSSFHFPLVSGTVGEFHNLYCAAGVNRCETGLYHGEIKFQRYLKQFRNPKDEYSKEKLIETNETKCGVSFCWELALNKVSVL